ncbi:MAG: hypothetical protein ASARMPREDX12_009098 [Alectoria sarmentosa]|nr:MAG: hypothetical protein ASARMPREDX12_009098 [Alectoria sarmentosa]
MFPRHSWEDHEVQTIRGCYLKVLSILVMIAWPGVCGHDKSGFRKHFLQRPHHDLADPNLPLANDRLGFLKEYAINFREEQYAFCPIIIEEREVSYIQEVAADRPLPFTEEEGILGEGASGKVRKAVIARYCFRDLGRILNVKVWGDIKLYGGAGSFRREFRRLGWVKEAKEDIRIMKHIAALAHGANVMILLPMAEHFDLDVFLRHGFKPTRDTKEAEKLYDFNTRFPGLKDDELSAALIKELCELASAVQWLHEGNEASQSLYRSLAHMDLKPENILVAEDRSSLIGKWMLTDFGVSLFSLSQEVSSGQSARTTASSYFDEPRRGCGTYQPPEIKHPGIDGRKCDVWSFGCILVDVMSFALGRTKLFQKVRALRNYGGDDYFYQTKLGRMDAQTSISSANTKLKTPIRHWLNDQKGSATHADRVLFPALRLEAPSSQGPPLRIKFSSEKISKSSFAVKDTDKITALALSPSGDQAALLFSHVCRVYATSDDIATEKISIRLERMVQWTRMCIGSQYLVVYGTERGPVFQNRVLVFDARVCRTAPVWEFNKEILGVQVSDVIISTEGMAAGAYENRLLIHDLSSVSLKSTDPFFISLLDRKSVDRKLELAQGLTIKNLAFGAKGRWLCAWAISVDQGCDRSYFWEISQQSIDFHGSGCYRRVDDASTNFSLWCYPNTPACVVHERHYGLTSIVQPNGQTAQNPESRQDLAIPGQPRPAVENT